MWRLPWALLIVVVACTVTPAAPAATIRPTSTSIPVTTADGSVPDSAALCNGYLVLLRSGDDAPLRAALDDSSILRDLDIMLADEGEFAAIARAALRVEEAVVGRCAQRFAAGTEPASDDTAALKLFMSAIQEGNEAGAEKVAWANVVAQMPWVPGGPEGFTFEIEGSTATAQVGPTIMIVCHARAGIVVACTFVPV